MVISFHPLPALKKPILAELFLDYVKTNSSTPLLNPLSNDILINKIFSILDKNSLFNSMLVSKNWYLLIQSNINLILKFQHQEENKKIARQNEIIQFIFNNIKNKLNSDPEGNTSKLIAHQGFMLSDSVNEKAFVFLG